MMIRSVIAIALWSCSLAAYAAFSCAVTSSPLGFGNFDPDGPMLDSDNGLINVRCQVVNEPSPISVSYTIALSTGNSGNYAARRMNNAGSALLYNLYVNSSRLPGFVWGDGVSAGTQVVGATITNLSNSRPMDSRDHTIFGRIPAPQSGIAPGIYTDALVVTVSF